MQGLGVLFPLSWKSAYEFSFCPLDPKFCILEFNQPHIMWYYSMYFMKNNLCTSGLLQFKLMLFMGQLYSTLFWKWSAFCKSNFSFLDQPAQKVQLLSQLPLCFFTAVTLAPCTVSLLQRRPWVPKPGGWKGKYPWPGQGQKLPSAWCNSQFPFGKELTVQIKAVSAKFLIGFRFGLRK